MKGIKIMQWLWKKIRYELFLKSKCRNIERMNKEIVISLKMAIYKIISLFLL